MSAFRIKIRRFKSHGKVYEYFIFKDLSENVRLLKLRCPRDIVVRMFSKVGSSGSWADTKFGRAMGLLVRDNTLFKKALILASIYDCTRREIDINKVLETVGDLDDRVADYWYELIVRNYSPRTHHGICRVVAAFRTLYSL